MRSCCFFRSCSPWRSSTTAQLSRLEAVVPDALLFALTMVALNTVVGLYQRNPGRTIAQTTARIVLSLLLAVPVAWAIFTFLPRAAAWNETLRLAVPVAFVTFVAIRGIVAHSGMSPMFARRTLVLGIGAEAVAVEQSIGQLGQAIRLPRVLSGEEERRRAPGAGNRVLGSGDGSRRRGRAATRSTKSSSRCANGAAACCRCASCSIAS